MQFSGKRIKRTAGFKQNSEGNSSSFIVLGGKFGLKCWAFLKWKSENNREKNKKYCKNMFNKLRKTTIKLWVCPPDLFTRRVSFIQSTPCHTSHNKPPLKCGGLFSGSFLPGKCLNFNFIFELFSNFYVSHLCHILSPS